MSGPRDDGAMSDDAAESYDPAADDYDLAKDPRCLWGWGPPTRDCRHMFGHACFRAFGHKGMCADKATCAPHDKCETCQRPKHWDTAGRSLSNGLPVKDYVLADGGTLEVATLATWRAQAAANQMPDPGSGARMRR